MLEYCPGCQAKVVCDDALCYRCGMDFALLRGVIEAAFRYRRKAVLAINSGDFAAALQNATKAYSLYHDPAIAKTMALSHMLSGHYSDALRWQRLTDL